MELFLGLWFICGLGAAIVANSKGRSGCGWLIVGFCLGPIGLIISAGISNLAHEARFEELAKARSDALDTTYPCPACAERIQLAATLCRFCHTPLTPPTTVTIGEDTENRGLSHRFGKFVGSGGLSPVSVIILLIIVVAAVRECAG